MQLEGKEVLFRLQNKNRGNLKLAGAISKLVTDLEGVEIKSVNDLRTIRKDAEKVHSNGFYFVDIHIHRALILILIEKEEATIVWAGTHQEYERIFRNNKNSIEKWLRKNKLLQ